MTYLYATRRGLQRVVAFSLLGLMFAGVARADDPRDEIEARARERIERLAQRQVDDMNRPGLFRRFRPIVDALNLPEERQPKTLFELSNALGDHPDLMAKFMAILEKPLAHSVNRRDEQIGDVALRRDLRVARLDRVMGPRPEPSPSMSYLDSQLRILDPRSYTVSARYEAKPEAVIEKVSLEFQPIQFEYLEAQDFNDDGGMWGAFCLNKKTCEWPLIYDLIPPQIYVYWRTTLSMSQLNDILAQQDYDMVLTLNGQALTIGPQVPYYGKPSVPGQGYWAMTMPTDAGVNYIVTVIQAKDVLDIQKLPWDLQLSVYNVEPLDFPELLYIDSNGNPVFAYNKLIPYAEPSVMFTANPTNTQTYFEALIFPTFQSDRCTDCHGFGTFTNIAKHHGYSEEYVDEFISNTGAQLAPSAYVPGAHVMTCVSCHHIQKHDEHGNLFAEVEWKAPFVDLDINWREKDAAQTCDRVTTNLPTPELRHDHFHLDGRLFWAIQKPIILNQMKEPAAEPKDFDEFLRRIDIWNVAGAPCP